eukprot:599024-Pelagomonas_calceolata.AAC.1
MQLSCKAGGCRTSEPQCAHSSIPVFYFEISDNYRYQVLFKLRHPGNEQAHCNSGNDSLIILWTASSPIPFDFGFPTE